MGSSLQVTFLKIATVLWVIWGAVHLFAGIIVLTSDAHGAVQAVADAVPPEDLVGDYHGAVAGLFNQHGWNLGWFGIATIIGGILIWRGNMTAIWVTGMIGGLADVGYLLFLDLPGYVNFFPGTVMTFISGSAIVLSFYVWFARRGEQDSNDVRVACSMQEPNLAGASPKKLSTAQVIIEVPR